MSPRSILDHVELYADVMDRASKITALQMLQTQLREQEAFLRDLHYGDRNGDLDEHICDAIAEWVRFIDAIDSITDN